MRDRPFHLLIGALVLLASPRARAADAPTIVPTPAPPTIVSTPAPPAPPTIVPAPAPPAVVPTPAPPAPPTIVPTPTPPRPRVPWIFVSGVVEIEAHPGNNMILWGVRPSVVVARGHWQAALDVDAMAGDPSVALGDVNTHLLAATLAAGPRLSLGHVIIDLAACGRFGWIWMAGHTSDASAITSSGSAPFASAGGRLGIFLPTAAKVSHLRALVEAGATIHGLDATVNGTTAAGLTGGYLLFGVGFGENK